MTIPERVRILTAEFGPEGPATRDLFRAELLSHFQGVDRAARLDCSRAARTRAQVAQATGDAAGAAACLELAQFLAEGGLVGA